MNCPLHRTTALGFDTANGGSGIPAAIGVSGVGPAAPNRGDWSGLEGKRVYRLTEITPTA